MDIGTDVFVGAFGFGAPCTYAFMTEGPVRATGDLSRDFSIKIDMSGLVSPTLNGIPTFAATPLNQALAWAQIVCTVDPHQGAKGADRIAGTAAADVVLLGRGNG